MCVHLQGCLRRLIDIGRFALGADSDGSVRRQKHPARDARDNDEHPKGDHGKRVRKTTKYCPGGSRGTMRRQPGLNLRDLGGYPPVAPRKAVTQGFRTGTGTGTGTPPVGFQSQRGRDRRFAVTHGRNHFKGRCENPLHHLRNTGMVVCD